MLHVTSTDLQSWTTVSLPYEGMSLTTYQSKFVAVGGCDPTTYEHTDLLFTSDTGLQWHSSLPPMPTKRSYTSSVNSRSPEFVVVAGGQGSGSRELDIVEMLLGDHWSTVDPLPAPCYDMHATLHNGNMYFMGGDGQGDIVYTCNCHSLISSCEKSSSDTTANTPLWGQFKAPRDYTVVVSYLSRLVSIDGVSTIRAYSSMSQSWVKATSVGEGSEKDTDYVAAAVLPTGELVFAHDKGGVYRIKLSGECCYVSGITKLLSLLKKYSMNVKGSVLVLVYFYMEFLIL